jgi:hypothetical protein
VVWLALVAAVLPLPLPRLLGALSSITDRLDALDDGHGPRQVRDYKQSFVPESWAGSG